MHVLAADVSASTRGQVACELQASSVMTSLSGVTVDCVPLLVFPLVVSVMLCGCYTPVIPWSHLSCTWVDFGWRLGWLLSHLGTIVIPWVSCWRAAVVAVVQALLVPHCFRAVPCAAFVERRSAGRVALCGSRSRAACCLSSLAVALGRTRLSPGIAAHDLPICWHRRPLFAKFGSGHCATFGSDHV